MGEHYLDIETTGLDMQESTITAVAVGTLDGNSLVIYGGDGTSEKTLLRHLLKAYPKFFSGGWGFVPVGFNIHRFDMILLWNRAVHHGFVSGDKDAYLTKPSIDLRGVAIMLNGGRFKGSSLQDWSDKELDGGAARDAVARGDWDSLQQYIHQEYQAFCKFYNDCKGLELRRKPVTKYAWRDEKYDLPAADTGMLAEWYGTDAVLYELAKQLRFRFMSCKKADIPTSKGSPVFVRYYLGYTVDLLRKAFKHLNVTGENTKLYYDLAVWTTTPAMSWDYSKRKKQRKDWEARREECFVGLDFAIDLDAPSPDEWRVAYTDARLVRDELVRRGLPFSVRWSGSKGFHFVVSHEAFDDLIGCPSSEWVEHHITLASEIEARTRVTTLDYAIYDRDRVLALPYSVSERGLVVWPLSPEEFDGFSIDLVRPSNINKLELRNRGLMVHNPKEGGL